MNFNKHIETSRIFVRDLAVTLGSPEDTSKAYRVLRAVFSVLRERLTVEESFDLISQLPFLLKAAYVDGWRPHRAPSKIRHVDDFVEEVRKADSKSSDRDFGNEENARKVISAVFHTIKLHISTGEAQDIEHSFPRELRFFWAAA